MPSETETYKSASLSEHPWGKHPDGKVIKPEELECACEYWQVRLRLWDWKIAVQIVRFTDIPDQAGNVEWYITKKIAEISLLAPEDFINSIFPLDMEQTLVHELLHLHFALFKLKKNSSKYIAQEQAIDCIAQALVRERRLRNDSSKADAA